MKVLFLCKCLFFPIMYQRICLKHPESSEAFKSELQVKLARERKCIFLTIWEVNRQINLWFLTTDIYVSNVTLEKNTTTKIMQSPNKAQVPLHLFPPYVCA